MKKRKTPYITLVDCGDAVQGDLVGTVSQGEYIIDIINKLGYKYAVLGNHEFDYGMKQVSKLIDKASFKYLAGNIDYNGSKENAVNKTRLYSIDKYGSKSVAFIGVTIPFNITSSSPKSFMDQE